MIKLSENYALGSDQFNEYILYSVTPGGNFKPMGWFSKIEHVTQCLARKELSEVNTMDIITVDGFTMAYKKRLNTLLKRIEIERRKRMTKIREERERQGISQVKLALLTGSCKNSVVNWDNGTVPTEELMEKICEVLDKDVDELLDEEQLIKFEERMEK